MNWVFARNDGGRDSGFHDAGVETFKGNLDRYLARELIQNSLDARDNPESPVHVKFELITLSRKQVPGVKYLEETFIRCAEYWQDQAKAHAFFEEAAQLATRSRMSALRVSDYNTTGVPGGDSDRTKNWYHLIRCAGSSSKGSGEGGSFGIGKNAPFAASRLRTVLYSTRTPDDLVAFQGVSTLVSHELPDGGKAQPTGFLGGKHGESIRVLEQIPPTFRRAECGLDISILEYPAATTWENDLVYSVLENFWPAIALGDLVATIGAQTINRGSLPKLLEQFSGQEDFAAHLYYRAYETPTLRRDEILPTLGKCSVFLLTGDPDLPKRMAMVRTTGMVIFLRGYLRSLVPFCGVFLCQDAAGNAVLREMEPPRHDGWDPDHPERGANKKVEKEYMGFIRECVKQLLPTDDSKVIAVPDLSRYLPDDDETDEEAFEGNEAATREETPDRSPLPEVIPGRKVEPRKVRMQPDDSKPEGEEEETEDGIGDGTGGGLGRDRNEGDGGTGAGGGGEGQGSAHRATGSKGGPSARPAVPISYRTYASTPDGSQYILVVRRETPGEGQVNLLVSTVGDDQTAAAEIEEAHLEGGLPISVQKAGVLGPVLLEDQTAHRIVIALVEPRRVAMEVTGIEA